MKYHFNKVQDLVGFSTKNTKKGEVGEFLSRSLLTSDDPEFYLYSEKISNIFLNTVGVLIDNVNKFLVVVHQDLSADLYVNDIEIQLDVYVKRGCKKGDAITQDNIANIRKARFPKIYLNEKDKIIFCFKVGWRFGLFFDLTPRTQPANLKVKIEKFNIEKAEESIGELYRVLTFYHVYKTLEADEQYKEMIKDGWFPFVEIIGSEYKQLSEIYKNKFDFENRSENIIKKFTEERINKITEKWWSNKIFSDKKKIINAAINAYLNNNSDGYINCIKNLCSEIEGILRKIYHLDTGKGNHVKTNELISHIITKNKEKIGPDYSLFLPLPFLDYLSDVVFAKFNLEQGEVTISRNSSSHGVADAQQYTKARALQLILVIDQLFYFS